MPQAHEVLGAGPLGRHVRLIGQMPPHWPDVFRPQGVGPLGTHSQPLSSGFTRHVSAAVGQSPPHCRMPIGPHDFEMHSHVPAVVSRHSSAGSGHGPPQVRVAGSSR